MKFSFHGGHSGEFCCHAGGTLRDVISAYLAAGFSHIAISEHLPSRAGFVYPDEQELAVEELEKRFSRLMGPVRSELRSEFGNRCQLFIGFETEFYGENPLDALSEAFDRWQPEIIVASVHHVQGIPIDLDQESFDKAAAACGGIESLFCSYYDHQYELYRFLSRYVPQVPVVAGHIDLIRLFRPETVPTPAVWERLGRNIYLAAESGIVFEVNSRALKKGLSEPYPSLGVLEEIKRQNGRITFGDDSHGPSEVGLFLAEARQFASRVFSSAVVFEHQDGAGYRLREVDL